MRSGQGHEDAVDPSDVKIDGYLRLLDQPKKRGRPLSAEVLRDRISAIQPRIESAQGLARLRLIQEQVDLEDQLADLEARQDEETALEAHFVSVASSYGAKYGIDYRAWRQMGVPAGVLRAAGIAERRRRRGTSSR